MLIKPGHSVFSTPESYVRVVCLLVGQTLDKKNKKVLTYVLNSVCT